MRCVLSFRLNVFIDGLLMRLPGGRLHIRASEVPDHSALPSRERQLNGEG